MQKKYTPQANLDANFEDRNAFVIGMAKFGEEAAVQSTLNETLEKGQRHAVNYDDNDNSNDHDDNGDCPIIGLQYNTKGDALHLAELLSTMTMICGSGVTHQRFTNYIISLLKSRENSMMKAWHFLLCSRRDHSKSNGLKIKV